MRYFSSLSVNFRSSNMACYMYVWSFGRTKWSNEWHKVNPHPGVWWLSIFFSISLIFCSIICTYFIIFHLFRLTFSACKSRMKNMTDSCLWVFWFLAFSTRQRKMTHSSIQNNQLVQLKEKIDDCSSLNTGPTFNLLFILEECHVIRTWGIFQKKRLFPENGSYEA